jgi:hypothetical protein
MSASLLHLMAGTDTVSETLWFKALKRVETLRSGHMYGSRVGQKRGAYRVLVGKSEGRGLLARPRSRLEDNIKMDFR